MGEVLLENLLCPLDSLFELRLAFHPQAIGLFVDPHLADKLFQLRPAVVDQAMSGYPCLALLDFGRIVFSHCCSSL